MRTIDISARESITVTGDLSRLHIPLGKGGGYVEVVIGEEESYFALCHGGKTEKSALENQGKTYDRGSSIQWVEVDYTAMDIEFWGGGRVAVFTLHYRRGLDTTSDGGLYESMRPYTALLFVDTATATSLSLPEATALGRGEADADGRDVR